MPVIELPDYEPIVRLGRDAKQAAKELTETEIRFLVDLYYQIQDFRISAAGQKRSMTAAGEPIALLGWSFDTMQTIEKEIHRWLSVYSEKEKTGMGLWAQGICGIGPVLSAGLLAHIDISQAPTVGHIWRFAGLDPTAKWEKGGKRPHNARLKVLCWKIGESFVKVSRNDNDIYGKLYLERKAYEHKQNDLGVYAEQAKAMLERKNFRNDTKAKKEYSVGRLPDGHIHARAKRWAVKLFLAHWHAEAYRRFHGTEPPLPYPIAHLGHVHVR